MPDPLHRDIERYIRGEMSPEEMHALEKRALDDPFLSDALEGASALDPQSFTEDLATLGTALGQTEKKKNKTIPLWARWGMGIAASLLALAVLTWFIVPPAQSPEPIALNPSPKTNPDPIVQKGPLPEAKPERKQDTERVAPETQHPKEQQTEKSNPSLAPAQPTEQAQENETQAKTEAVQPTEQAQENEFQLKAEEPRPVERAAEKPVAEGFLKKEARSASPALAENDRAMARPQGAAKSVRDEAPAKTVRGRVTDREDGDALPGVNVTVKGTTLGTVTDAEGNYTLQLPAGADKLVFSFVGLETVEASPGQATAHVEMSQDVSQLSEVVVTGYGEGDKILLEDFPEITLAEPEGGRRAYKKYLEQNLQYPVQAIENKVQGKVTVQFALESNGAINGYRVIKSLGFGCDEEVIRLIKEGPRWSPSKKNDLAIRSKVRVRVRFTLPAKK